MSNLLDFSLELFNLHIYTTLGIKHIRGRGTIWDRITWSSRSMVNLPIYQVPRSTAWKPLYVDSFATKDRSQTNG